MALFTNSQIASLQLKAEEMMADGVIANQYVANAEAAKAVLSNQTIQITPLEGTPEKDRQVEVSYIDTCAIEDQACPTDFCDFTSPELATKKKIFDLNLCRAAFYSIDENDLAKSIYGRNEAVPRGQIAAKNVLDEYISTQVLLSLNANAGTNLYPAPYTYNAPEKTTYIAEADYTRKVVPYFEKMAMMHKIANPYYIDNGQLWIDWRNAQLDAGNDSGRGDKARVDAIKLYFDMFGFTKAGISVDDTFLVGQHAIGVASRTYNPDTPTTVELKGGNQIRYKESSVNLPGIDYDVFYQIECSGRRFKHSWMYVFTGGVFVQPEGCEAGVTGIMSFSAGVAP